MVSLLQENADSDLPPDPISVNRPSNLTIKSQKMPPLSKHKWISLFLDQVQKDLTKINWNWRGPDNLSKKERQALKELQNAPNIRSSDKGGKIVLLSGQQYEQQVMRKLSDTPPIPN